MELMKDVMIIPDILTNIVSMYVTMLKNNKYDYHNSKAVKLISQKCRQENIICDNSNNQNPLLEVYRLVQTMHNNIMGKLNICSKELVVCGMRYTLPAGTSVSFYGEATVKNVTVTVQNDIITVRWVCCGHVSGYIDRMMQINTVSSYRVLQQALDKL